MARGMYRTISMVLMAGTIAHAPAARAQAELVRSIGTETTPRSTGMADALTASGISTAAVFLNPAGVALGSLFHAEGWYGYANDLSQHVVGVAAVDSTTPVGGGLGFTYTYTGLQAEESNHYDVRAALAMPLADVAAVGVNLKYVRVDYAEVVVDSPGFLNDFSLDAGAMVMIDPFFFGVVGTNLTDLDHPLAPMALTLGAGVTIGTGRLEFNTTFDWSSYDEVEPMGMKYALGGEILLADVLVLRAGYRFEDVPNVHGITAGIGYVDPNGALDFGFQQDLSGVRSDTQIGFSARYFIR